MNPVFLNLGIIEIRWYSVTMFLAMLIGGYLFMNEAKKFSMTEDDLINLIFWLIPISLLGARLYYVAFNWTYYSQNLIEIVEVWKGGLAIHGGMLFGLIYLLLYAHKHHMSAIRLLDIAVVSLLIGQAIGRWGNFFNSEAYGPATTLEFLQGLHLPQFIIDGMYINGTYYQPTFLYESLWCFIGFIIALFSRKRKYLKLGELTSFYFVWYGIGRFFIEGLRTDSLMLGSLKMAQLVSIAMIIIGILMFIIVKRGSVFDRLYTPSSNLHYSDLPKQSISDFMNKIYKKEAPAAKHATTSVPTSNVLNNASQSPTPQPVVKQAGIVDSTPTNKNNINIDDKFKW